MATGGAWQSEYFEKSTGGPGLRVPDTPPPAMGVQATPPAMYHVSNGSTKGRGTIIVAVVLRLLTFLLALVSLALVIAGKGTFGVTTSASDVIYETRTVRFTILGAGKYLFAACVIVALYSLVMTGLNLTSLCVRALANSHILLSITFTFDQVLAYVLISAGAAAANAVIANTKASENVTGISPESDITCSNLGINGVCSKAAVSVALAFVAFLLLAITSVLSARRLFRS